MLALPPFPNPQGELICLAHPAVDRIPLLMHAIAAHASTLCSNDQTPITASFLAIIVLHHKQKAREASRILCMCVPVAVKPLALRPPDRKIPRISQMLSFPILQHATLRFAHILLSSCYSVYPLFFSYSLPVPFFLSYFSSVLTFHLSRPDIEPHILLGANLF